MFVLCMGDGCFIDNLFDLVSGLMNLRFLNLFVDCIVGDTFGEPKNRNCVVPVLKIS